MPAGKCWPAPDLHHDNPPPELRLCPLDEPQDEQQDHRADEGHNDRADYASAGRNPQHASKESANHRANDADDDIDDQAKPTTFYDLSRQPAGDGARRRIKT